MACRERQTDSSVTQTTWIERLLSTYASITAKRAYARFVGAARHAPAVQEAVLKRHLARHAASDFGATHGFDRITTYAEFARRVPIAGYEAFAPYIARLRRGDFRALLGPRQRVLMFALTSGTTAEPKYIPVTREFLRSYQRGWNAWGVKTILDHPNSFFRGIVQITSPMRDHETEAGIPCGAITGLLAACQKRLVRKYYVAPLAVADIRDAAAKYYAIMRLAVPRDVSFLVTANPTTLLRLARVADERKESLIRDVRDGTLCRELDVPDAVRRALSPRLRPDPTAAARLHDLAERHGVLRPADYWNLSFIAHWTGGTMGLYRRFFAPWYGDAPVRDIGLLASEGRMSVPIEDGTASGVLDVTMQFFEFIPAHAYGSPRPPVLRCHELREGAEYFVLLTNATGLCRYDIGDRVRVTGWFGPTPMIEFLSKGAHTSSLVGEKLTEDQVVEAMGRAVGPDDPAVDGFVLSPRFDETPYYALYLDADAHAARPRDERAVLARRLDEALCAINVEYASKRETERLDSVRLVVLPAGFLRRRDAERRAAASCRAEQFKHAFLLPRPGLDADWVADQGNELDAARMRCVGAR